MTDKPRRDWAGDMGAAAALLAILWVVGSALLFLAKGLFF